MKRTIFAALAVATLLTSNVLATFPDVPIDGNAFNYADPLYMGDYFSFATNLTYSEGVTPNSSEVSTGFNGFSVPADAISPIPGFVSGDEVPVNGQNLGNLFPATVPGGLVDLWSDNSMSAVGNFQDGFSEFALHQKKVSQVSDDNADFLDGFAEGKANVPFEVWSDSDELVPAKLDVHLDSVSQANFGGGLSEGVAVQLINVTDPENPELLYNISGFYFLFEGFFDASFAMGETDLTDNLMVESTGESGEDPIDVNFSFDMDIMLDPSMVYAVNVQSDVSTFVQNGGFASIDSSNTLDATIRLLDATAALAIPGANAIPEPSAACLLIAGCIAAAIRRKFS